MSFGNKVIRHKLNFTILDGLRGIAAAYVVVNHCRGHLLMGGSEYAKIRPVSEWTFFTKAYYSTLQITSLGTEFVILFFVLSGFSITHSLAGKVKGTNSFYKRRLIRLYPPYILALIYAGVVFALLKNFVPSIVNGQYSVLENYRVILSNMIYIPSGSLIAQFWSLTHEVIFYILIPLFFFVNVRYYLLFSVAGFVLGLFISPIQLSQGTILAKFFFDYNIFFALGISLYINYDLIRRKLVLKKPLFLTVSIILFCLIAAVKFLMGADTNKITMLLSSVLSVFLIVNFLHYSLTNRVLRSLGAMSYTIYVTHFASIYLFALILIKTGFTMFEIRGNWFLWIAGVFFCILISVPLYYLVEHPTKKILASLRS